jgi:cytochrome b pre-mRNA-processing protein 3
MIFPLFRRNRRPDTISALYGMIVAQARSPAFYRDYRVADTVNGRFDLLLLHVALVVARLMREEAGRDAAQALFDRFCTDIDENLREIGIGDLSVPKHMRRVGEAFYGRAQVYHAALAESGDRALVDAVRRNVDGGPYGPAAVQLAAYMRQTSAMLAGLSGQAVRDGRFVWPDPVAVPAMDESTPVRG